MLPLVAVPWKEFAVKPLVGVVAEMEHLDLVAVQPPVPAAVAVDLAVVPVVVAVRSCQQWPWLSFPIDFHLRI